MKREASLEEKLKNAETQMPGVWDQLKPYDFGSRSYSSFHAGAIQDLEYVETEKYQVVAAKWDEHYYGGRGGIEWSEWVSIHYREKGSREIKQTKTERIETRNRYDAREDKKHLWPYNFVKIEVLESDQVKVSWADENGETLSEVEYTIKLE